MPPEPLTVFTSELLFRDWGSIHADLAFIYEGEVAAGFRDSPCYPDFLGAWLVQQGTARLTQEGRTVQAKAGEWIVMRPAAGRQWFSDDARILSIRFQAEWPDRKPFFELGLSTVLPAVSHPGLETKGRRLLAVVRNITPETPTDLRAHPVSLQAFIEIKTHFFEWFSELCTTLDRVGVHPTRTMLKDERIAKVLHNLDRLPLSTHLREEELAANVGLQVGQFVRVFRREVGTTPKRYFDERRREACRRLLASTDTPIKEIALELGYLRLSDFSAWFSAHQGTSPRDFRKEFRDGARPHLL
jgi:AraC-like DNA-binding protein